MSAAAAFAALSSSVEVGSAGNALSRFSPLGNGCKMASLGSAAPSLPLLYSSLWGKEGVSRLRLRVERGSERKILVPTSSAFFYDLLHNKALMCATAACVSAQVLKPMFSALDGNGFNIKLVLKSGGMPSSHSAVVTSLATAIGFEKGVDDSVFALAVVYASVVMYDAQGVRRAVGKQAEVINTLVVPALASKMLSPASSNNLDAKDVYTPYTTSNAASTWESLDAAVSIVEEKERILNLSSSPTSRTSSSAAAAAAAVGASGSPGIGSLDYDPPPSNTVGALERNSENGKWRAADMGGSQKQSYEFEEKLRTKSFWNEIMEEPSVKKGEVERQEIGKVEGWRHIPLKESVGHSKTEVVVGGVYGVALAFILYPLLVNSFPGM